MVKSSRWRGPAVVDRAEASMSRGRVRRRPSLPIGQPESRRVLGRPLLSRSLTSHGARVVVQVLGSKPHRVDHKESSVIQVESDDLKRDAATVWAEEHNETFVVQLARV